MSGGRRRASVDGRGAVRNARLSAGRRRLVERNSLRSTAGTNGMNSILPAVTHADVHAHGPVVGRGEQDGRTLRADAVAVRPEPLIDERVNLIVRANDIAEVQEVVAEEDAQIVG